MPSPKELLAEKISKAVGAGKPVASETVDFSDANRPKTCLEVDFPILPINELASIEASSGATKKPVYQLSKWWARRQPSVFRSILIAAATRAPGDHAHAAKLVWDSYYANHTRKSSFEHLNIFDIFMGGGTTLLEGSRLGMNMAGTDLNPVAWFVAKQSLASVDWDEVRSLLADVEAEVRAQIIPFYYCDGPNGERGKWIHLPTGRIEHASFDPLTLTHSQRSEYRYEGPEVIYTFWAKHGPCQVTGCGHRTPIMSSPVVAVKSLAVRYWEHTCTKCGTGFHAEELPARMAPDVALYVAPDEFPHSSIDPKRGVSCPICGFAELTKLGKSKTKKIELALLVHPQWLAGCASNDERGGSFGGSAQDDSASTLLWNNERAKTIRLLEVRGRLPETVTCPVTRISFRTDKDGGTVPKKSAYTCAACGTVQDILETIKATKKTGPMAAYAVKAYSPSRHSDGALYGGRFFSPFDRRHARQFAAALDEWNARKDSDLADYWPRSELPYGFMTHHLQGGVPNHGFTHWWMMFNPRQLLVHAQLLRAITAIGNHKQAVREFVLAAFQQYLRNQNMFCFWNTQTDKLEPLFSNNNYHPKATVVENSVYPTSVRGNWAACVEGLQETVDWQADPWETISNAFLTRVDSGVFSTLAGKSSKAYPRDRVGSAKLYCGSSTDLSSYVDTGTVDLVITDPPFGGLLHYSELSDFFYVWLRLVLKSNYPGEFEAAFTPKALEVVSNRAREPDDPDGFYQRLLTQCWREAFRILKPGGILAFTFHHSEDDPWVAVLESLFDAGFYLEATYPIRSDETKGEGEFGSKTIEYDIIHVCRKRTEEPRAVSWGRMRREVLADVRQLQAMLENHAKGGLPAADLQVIRRGKALEYFSRHYGKIYVDEGRTISVKDALMGINQLIDEDAKGIGYESPPVTAEPITRQFLRMFDGKTELARDQMQKFLRGSGVSPDEFEQRGWCYEKSKVSSLVQPLEFARDWQGRHRRRLTSDLDQALVLIGACYDASGINASDTLKNDNFKPHAALKAILDWMSKRGASSQVRNAASRALSIYNNWAASQSPGPRQATLFNPDEGYA